MENQQQIPPVQSQILTLPGVSSLLKRSWQIYKERLATFIGIMIFPAIIRFLFLISAVFLKSLSPIFIILLFIIFYPVAIIISLWSSVSLLFAVKEREQKIGIKEAFTKGWHKIISYWWISILVSLITMGGFLLLVVPGIIFFVWFSLATYVLVSEDLKGMNALFRSKQWVSENWGKVFWRFFGIGIIAIVIFGGIIFLFNVFINKTVSDIASSIISLFLTPFLIIYSFLIYEDLKKVKGEIPFEVPKRGTKIKFILVGIAGLLLILTILILGRIVLTSLGGARTEARDTRRMADLGIIQTALEFYYFENNIYPSTLNELHKEIPKDPKTNLPYQYKVRAGGQDYQLCVDFEKLEDKCVNSRGEESGF